MDQAADDARLTQIAAALAAINATANGCTDYYAWRQKNDAARAALLAERRKIMQARNAAAKAN